MCHVTDQSVYHGVCVCYLLMYVVGDDLCTLAPALFNIQICNVHMKVTANLIIVWPIRGWRGVVSLGQKVEDNNFVVL